MTEAYTTIERWADYFNAGDGEAVAALYTPSAVLWGTLSRDMTVSPDGMKSYFSDAARLGLTVKLGAYAAQALTQDIAAIAGHYNLFRALEGRVTMFPSRYSIVLVRQETEWLIAQHHSSLKPDAGAVFSPSR